LDKVVFCVFLSLTVPYQKIGREKRKERERRVFVSCPPPASPYGIEIDREERERGGSGVCPPLLSHSVRVLESGSDFGVARSCPFSGFRARRLRGLAVDLFLG
jgi:hypothetical protein